MPALYNYTNSVVTQVIVQIPLNNHISLSIGCRLFLLICNPISIKNKISMCMTFIMFQDKGQVACHAANVFKSPKLSRYWKWDMHWFNMYTHITNQRALMMTLKIKGQVIMQS